MYISIHLHLKINTNTIFMKNDQCKNEKSSTKKITERGRSGYLVKQLYISERSEFLQNSNRSSEHKTVSRSRFTRFLDVGMPAKGSCQLTPSFWLLFLDPTEIEEAHWQSDNQPRLLWTMSAPLKLQGRRIFMRNQKSETHFLQSMETLRTENILSLHFDLLEFRPPILFSCPIVNIVHFDTLSEIDLLLWGYSKDLVLCDFDSSNCVLSSNTEANRRRPASSPLRLDCSK